MYAIRSYYEIILAGRDNVLRIPTAALQEGGQVLVLKDGA